MKAKKRFLAMMLSILMILSFASFLPQGAFTDGTIMTAAGYSSGNYDYNVLDDGTIEISKYKGSDVDVTIPSKIDGKVVKSIGDGAFRYCTSLTSVTIPNSVTSIGWAAFSRCESLTSVTIPSSVTSIVNGVFSSCSSLTSVTIPGSVTSIGDSAFYDCTSLKSVTIPNSVKSIGKFAFYYCTSLTSVSIPSSVESIGWGAFSDCKSLKSVSIPSSVKSVDNRVFAKCESLTSVTIPSCIKSIGDGAFLDCTSLKSVTIPNGVTSIGEGTFSGCISLTSITIPGSVTIIGQEAFYNCTKLTSVTIPSSVTIIALGAFSGCESLTSVTIPNSVTSIGWAAFSCCESLTSVTIPSSVTSIGGSAFIGCKSLNSVSIPSSVTSIGENALGYYSDENDYYTTKKINSFTIYGFKGTAAEKYAKENGFKYEILPEYSLESSKNKVTIAKDSLKDLTLTYHRSKDDSKTFSNFVGIEVDGKTVDPKNYTAESGSLKLTLKKDYLSKLSVGTHDLVVRFKDTYAETTLVVRKTAVPITSRLAGANRYETASVISSKMFKQSDTVIVATGLTFHDAMVAVPLASAYNAPLLLATEKHITAQTEAELKRLSAKNVIVVSTNGAIGAKAKAEFKAAKYNMTYIEGKTCFETAAKVAKALQTKTKKTPDTIFFATDSSFADALSASPIAAIKGAPIMYLKNKGSIDKVTADYLKSVKGKVKNAYIIGGDGVISDAMMKNVANALGLTVNKTVQRVAGKNRYETCVAVNNKFKSVLTGDGICVAKGLDFPDALAGGVLAAKNRIPLFLADGKKLLDCQNTYLKGRKASKLYVLGGTGAVSDELVMLIAQASV